MTSATSHFDERIGALRAKATDSFSQQVLEGAAHALRHEENPLRLTFFATSMRILFEHLMDTLAPRNQVRECKWFDKETDDGRPTRRQRITYAIQGGLTDAFIQDELGVDPEPLKGTLLRAVDALSRHIHGRETTIITERAEQDTFAEATLNEMEALLDAIQECRNAVLRPIEEELDEAAVDALLYETIQAIDELASHHSIEEIYVEKTIVHLISPDTVTFRATGSVDAILQFGSNSDLRRGDGAELPQSFPFWCDIALPIEFLWDLQHAETECGVDNSDWYANRYDE